VQVLYCRDKLGIPNEKLNVNGGSISHRPSLRHGPGARCTGHALIDGPSPQGQERRRHDVHRRWPWGAAGLFEVVQ